MGKVKHFFIIFFVLIILTFVLTGCINKKVYTKIKMEFYDSGCDKSLDTRKALLVPDWQSETTLIIKTIVDLNCGENITSADFDIEEGKITLIYTAPDCTKTNTCLRCMCKHELTYTITNLPRDDYQFEVKRIS